MTFKLIRDVIKFEVNASTKFWVCTSNGSAVRALTDRHTQMGPIPYPRLLMLEGMKLHTHWKHLAWVASLKMTFRASKKSMQHPKKHSLVSWPWPLTYDLDLDILPFDLHAKIQVCMSIHSYRSMRQMHAQTHTHTIPKRLHRPLTSGVKNNKESYQVYWMLD